MDLKPLAPFDIQAVISEPDLVTYYFTNKDLGLLFTEALYVICDDSQLFNSFIDALQEFNMGEEQAMEELVPTIFDEHFLSRVENIQETQAQHVINKYIKDTNLVLGLAQSLIKHLAQSAAALNTGYEQVVNTGLVVKGLAESKIASPERIADLERICEECGTEFIATVSTKKYCSYKCSKTASNRRFRLRNEAEGGIS